MKWEEWIRSKEAYLPPIAVLGFCAADSVTASAVLRKDFKVNLFFLKEKFTHEYQPLLNKNKWMNT